MKRIISLLVVMAMMLATVLAVIPVSATASTDDVVLDSDTSDAAEAPAVETTTKFLSEAAYEAFEQAFEGGAATNAFVNSVTPFAFNQLEAQEKLSNQHILNITLPIKKLNAPIEEDNGKVRFTISVFDIDDLKVVSSPVATYIVLVDPDSLTVGTFATIDLTSYNINVGPGETLGFGSATDTLLPAWYPGDSTLLAVANENAAFTTGIIGNTGKSNVVSQPTNSIFMDFEMRALTDEDGAVGAKVSTAEEFYAMKESHNYYLTEDITLAADRADKALNNNLFDGNGHTITIEGDAKGLFSSVANSTIKNLTLAGEGVTPYGLVHLYSGNVTFENVDVRLGGIKSASFSPYVGAVWAGSHNLVFKNCDNYTPVTVAEGSAAGFVAGANIGSVLIDGCNNYASMQGADRTGGFLGHVWTANGIVVKNSNNGSADVAITVKSTGLNAGGFIGETSKVGVLTFENCDNYAAVVCGSGKSAGGIAGDVSGGANSMVFNNCDNYGVITGQLTGGGIIGWSHGGNLTIDGCNNYANVSGQYVGGFAGAANAGATTTVKNSNNGSADTKVVISGSTYIGGIIGNANGNVSFTNVVNYGVPTGGATWGAGILAYFDSVGTLTLTNVVNNADNMVSGAWNRIGGGLVGSIKNAAGATIKFTDCVNNGNIPNANNAGGFLGGNENRPKAKLISFIRCTNNGDLTSTGNISGFLGQGGATEVYFEDCVNNGNISSTGNSNCPGGFIPWAGYDSATFVRCVNNGDISTNFHSSQLNKTAAGFASSSNGVTSFTDCVNTGKISSAQGDVAGFVTGNNTTLTRCYNIGQLNPGVYNGTPRKASDLAVTSGTVKLVDSIDTGLHADLIERVKELSPYNETVNKTAWLAAAAAINAARVVYDDAEATDEAKAAALAAIDKAVDNMYTWVNVRPDAVALGGSIIVSASSKNENGTDWIGLVKDGERDATIWIYVNEIPENFNILAKDPIEGKTLTEGDYTLFLIPDDATVAQVLDGEVESLYAIDIVISGKAINTAEEFLAMEETGDYVLGSDITLPEDYAGKVFKGTLEGHGHTITLTGTTGLFSTLDGATVKNLTLTAGRTTTFGLADTSANSVTIDNVTVDIIQISGSSEGTAAFVGKATGTLTITDSRNKSKVYHTGGGNTGAGGFVGKLEGTLNVTGCVNDGTIQDLAGWTNGYSGFVGTVLGTSKLYFVDCVNNCDVIADNTNAGGFVGQTRSGQAAIMSFIRCTNNGKISATGYSSGFVAQVSSLEYYFEDCTNTADVTSTNGYTASGFVATAGNPERVTFSGCTNSGNMTTKATAVGFISGIGTNCATTIKFSNCVNEGTMHSTNSHAAGFLANCYNCNTTFYNCENKGNVTADNGNAAGFTGDTWGSILYFLSNEEGGNTNSGNITSLTGNAAGFYNAGCWEVKSMGSVNTGNVVAKNTAVGIGFGGNGPRWFVNCENNGNVTSQTASAAGIFTENNIDCQTYEVTECVNNGKITAPGNAAGIAVNLEANDAGKGQFIVTFTDCVNNGDIVSTSADGSASAAGIVANYAGLVIATFNGCENSGTVANENGDSFGIAGAGGDSNTQTFSNCANYGFITAGGNGYQIVAGSANQTISGSVNEGFIEGSEPIEIWTAEDFMNMDIRFDYILMDDIVLPEDYQAINFGSPYAVVNFNGNGKTIYMKGLTCGLFDTLYNANIYDLNLVGYVTFTSGNGALAREVNDTCTSLTVSNVVIDVDITASGRAAGFIEWNRDADVNKTITFNGCVYLGNIDARGDRVGGFVAEWYVKKGTVTFNNCRVGAVGLDTHINGMGRVAGFAGKFRGSATLNADLQVVYDGCANFADVTAIDGTGAEGCVGGFGGRYVNCVATINGSVNYGDIVTNRSCGWIQGVGGFIGELNRNANLTILSSANYGDVYAKTSVAGGLVGAMTHSCELYIGSVVEDEEGEVVGYENGAANYGKVSNGSGWNYAAGGILGCADYNGDGFSHTNLHVVKIYNTVNYGEVTSTGANIGGFIGYTNSIDLIDIADSRNHGDIINVGGNNTAGFIGQGAAKTTKIINCANYGNVTTNTGWVAGFCAIFWGQAPENLVIDGCANFGNISGNGDTAAGIIARTVGTTTITNNINYGVISSAKGNASGIVNNANNGATVSGNVNAGIIAYADGAQICSAKEDDAVVDDTNIEAGVVLTDPDLIAAAKALDASWSYEYENWIGTNDVTNTTTNVDLATLNCIAKDEEGNIVYDYVDLYTSGEGNPLDASIKNENATSVPARAYYSALKGAVITNTTDYKLTLSAKSDAGVVSVIIAVDPNGNCVKFEDTVEAGTYATYEVSYDGREVEVVRVVNDEEVVDVFETTVAGGSSVAIGVYNYGVFDSAELLEEEETSTLIKHTTSVKDVTLVEETVSGGIVGAFAEAQAVIDAMANAEADVEELTDILDAAKANTLDKIAAEEAAAAEHEEAIDAYKQAAMGDVRDEELEALLAVVQEKLTALNAAHREVVLAQRAEAYAQAEYDSAVVLRDDLAETYDDDLADAKETVTEVIDSSMSYAGVYRAILEAMSKGVTFPINQRAAFGEAVNRAMDAETQAELDEAVAELNAILNGIDLNKLIYQIERANALDPDNFTPYSWIVVEKVLEKIYATDGNFETQDEVDALATELEAAIDALRDDSLLYVDTMAYIEQIKATYPESDADNYSVPSWNKLVDAIENLEAKADDLYNLMYPVDPESALAGAEFEEAFDIVEDTIVEAFIELNDVIDNSLVYIKDLKDAIAAAEELVENSADYSDITIVYVVIALPQAKSILNTVCDEDMTRPAAEALIANALELLTEVSDALVDVSELKALISTEVAEKVEADYTAESWNAFSVAVAEAKLTAVSAKTDDEVTAAIEALTAAMAALEEKVVIESESLEALIAEVKALNEADYTKASWADLKNALVVAEVALLLDDQTKIDEAKAALAAAKAALVVLDTESLEALIAEVEALDSAAYTPETWFVLVTALQGAKSALKADAQAEVDAAKDTLEAAKAALMAKAAVDTTALESLIAEIEALKADDYTAESWANVKIALEAAKAALTATEQTNVDVAKATLDAAKASLKKPAVEEPAETPTEPLITEPVEKKGCGSAIGATVVVMTAVLGLGATVVLKKKED